MDILVAIDQGTTSSRALAFDLEGSLIALEQTEFTQYYPKSGWVEHDGQEIWASVISVMRALEEKLKAQQCNVLAIGITNQRETTLLWDKQTSKPCGNAIVWQDRRTSAQCQSMIDDGGEDYIQRKTGLVLDPYFSATKIAWILDNRNLRGQSNLAFGTIESFLAFQLTGGSIHISDATNASRTNLMGLQDKDWSDDLLKFFDIPREICPQIVDNAGHFGVIAQGLPFEGVPITALIGDQQAAAIGQACHSKGQIKSTYGTGCFMLVPTETDIVFSDNRLLTTVATQINGKRTYALEGSIFNAGTVIQWMRDNMGLFDDVDESEALAQSVESSEGLYFVSAFTGLGAPHWSAEARGTLTGLERFHTKAHFVRAGLESVIFQTVDLIKAIEKDTGFKIPEIKIDGGMANNKWFAQELSNYCQTPVRVPVNTETTAQGAAIMAGLGAGIYSDLSAVQSLWKEKAAYQPMLSTRDIEQTLKGWRHAIRKCLV